MSNADALIVCESIEWGTPTATLDLVRQVLGEIEFDPASSPSFNRQVRAERFLTAEDDALTADWGSPSTIWLNPPGGKRKNKSLAALFWERLLEQRESPGFGHACFLGFSTNIFATTQSARLSIIRFPVCILRQRLSFLHEDGTPAEAPKHYNVVAYVPGRVDAQSVSQGLQERRRCGARRRAMTWLEDVKDLGAAGLAARIGWPVVEVRGKPRALKCPSCGAPPELVHREVHGADFTLRGERWVHASCGAKGKGSALDVLVAHVVGVGVDWQSLDGTQKVEVRRAAVRLGLTPDMAFMSAPRSPPRPPPPPRDDYPPAAEVEDLWRRCDPVDLHDGARAQLLARELNPSAVADLDLARGLPSGDLPIWAGTGRFRTWALSEHVVIVPLVDATGTIRSLHARNLLMRGEEMKALSPHGYASGGLLFADGFARGVLRGDPEVLEHLSRTGLVIREGVPDFLEEATRCSDADEEAPAVIGILSGGWKAEHAARIPAGTTVLIHGQDDKTGRLYVDDISQSFAHRGVRVLVRLSSNGEAA